MKHAIIPAQITTVEDRVIGELGLTQLLLLATPIFISAIIFVLVPPFCTQKIFKSIIVICIFIIFSALAIRIKGQLVLKWLFILSKYHLRPQYYLFDKNDQYLREKYIVSLSHRPKRVPIKHDLNVKIPRHKELENLIQLEEHAPDISFLINKQGAFSVYVKKIK